MESGLKRMFSKNVDLKRRAAGDALRDVGNWPLAEIEYRAYLSSVPDDQPIWVQLGHTCKEQGKLQDAKTAYKRSIEIDPDNADSYLQLGHVLKLIGDGQAAGQAYMKSFDLLPSKAAYEELSSLGQVDVPEDHRSANVSSKHRETTYMELDDLFDYLRHHVTVSGIQRVQLNILKYGLRLSNNGDNPIAYIRSDRVAGGFWQFAEGDLRVLVDYLGHDIVTNERLSSLIRTTESRATRVKPLSGDTYLVLGAFWGFGSNAARYTILRKAGVRVGVYIYDLIPITHPEFCASDLVSEFSFALGDGLHSFDFVLTISEFVAGYVKKYLHKHGLDHIPVQAVALAHQMHEGKISDQPIKRSRKLEVLEDRSFVLMVSTIEARKNHRYLFSIWKMMVEEGLDPPDLVFVGRFGWRVNDFRDMLIGTDFLDKRIHVLEDVSDNDLQALYQSCIFTAFPSTLEGWGLPVGESLAYGRPCASSNSSSMPEVGGEYVDYFDPLNVNDGLQVIKKLIFDQRYREQRTLTIKEKFIPRTWDDVGNDMMRQLKSMSVRPVSVYKPTFLKAGELLNPGDMCVGKTAPPNYTSRPLRTILAECCYAPEPFGCWLRGTRGLFWFMTDCSPGTEINVYMNLTGTSWGQGELSIDVGKSTRRKISAVFPPVVKSGGGSTLLLHGNFFCGSSGIVEADGSAYVHFTIEGATTETPAKRSPGDERNFHVGLISLAYAKSTDIQGRLDLSQHFKA